MNVSHGLLLCELGVRSKKHESKQFTPKGNEKVAVWITNTLVKYSLDDVLNELDII